MDTPYLYGKDVDLPWLVICSRVNLHRERQRCEERVGEQRHPLKQIELDYWLLPPESATHHPVRQQAVAVQLDGNVGYGDMVC